MRYKSKKVHMYIHGDLMCDITVDTKINSDIFFGWHMTYAWRYANYSQGSQIQGIDLSLCICHATGVEEDPKVTQDIRCLWRGGGAALIQTKQQFPQPKS